MPKGGDVEEARAQVAEAFEARRGTGTTPETSNQAQVTPPPTGVQGLASIAEGVGNSETAIVAATAAGAGPLVTVTPGAHPSLPWCVHACY